MSKCMGWLSKLWPYTKNSEVINKPINKPEIIKPDDKTIDLMASGEYNLSWSWVICYEHVNWAYQLLGSNVRVFAGEPIYVKHIVVFAGACIKYLEDLEDEYV